MSSRSIKIERRVMAWLARAVSCLTVAVAVCAATVAGARPLDDVVATKELRVIAYEDNEPFSWEQNGEQRGIEIDLARAVAAKLGVGVAITLRIQGEQVDTDLRTNVVRGTFGGGAVGDVMFHVPVDKELGIRVKEAIISNPYFQQRVALATHPERTGSITSFDVFKAEPIGVQLGTVSDYFLMRFEGGALLNNVRHYLKPSQGIQRFLAKEMLALLGVQSHMEALLKQKGISAQWSTPPMPGLARADWVLGIAVNEQSRDLGYAMGNALRELASDGTLQSICAKYGVTYVAPVAK
jgi:polar amino acid transport system substrate-binding protein